LLQNGFLALASFIFAVFLAAPAAQAQVPSADVSSADSRLPTLSELTLPPVNSPSVILASASLPNDPSAAPDPGASGTQPADQSSQPQSGQSQSSPTQPAGDPPAAPAQSTPNSGQASSDDQLKQQEHQRVLGVMAAFNTTQNHDALPLTSGQKFQLFFKSQTDPWPFGLAAVVAGIDQAEDDHHEYGQGFQGYAKRYGAAWGDAFIGNFFGNAVLTSLWHEDPRYFQKGTGSYTSRALWAATSTVWCKRDNGGWGPNYANVVGNLIGAAIANVYYPASERTVTDTITRGLTVSAEGIVGSEVIEFWPDMVRHYRRKHDEKLARQQAQKDAQDAAQPAPRTTSSPTPQSPQN
jgi:hypothetical protein